MAIVNSSAPAPSAIYVPGIGAPGRDGVDGLDGRDGTDGRDGAPGQGVIFTRTAAASIPAWRALVANADGSVIPADPSDPAHRGRVIGITVRGASVGLQASIQNAGDLLGASGAFTAGTTLFVGAGGTLVTTPPASGWRQVVATAVASGQIVVALGEARVVADEGTALVIPDGGFSSPATAADVQAGQDSSKFVTPAALDPALSGKLGLAALIQAAAGFNQPASNKTILDWLADLMVEGADLRALGFVGDGQSHPLSERFGTGTAGLAAAKAVFPRAVALTEEIDGHAIQRRVDLAMAGNYAPCIVLPRGSVALTSFPINSTATKACHVFSPGPARIKSVGTAAGCWTHGTETDRAAGPLTWRGVDLDTSSTAVTTGLTVFFGSSGAGRGQCLTIENARFDRMSRGMLLGNYPRGVKVDNLTVFGPDNVVQSRPAIEVLATADAGYGPASAKFTNCLTANYTWGWKFTDYAGLEGTVFENCRSYNGWGLCQVRCLRPNYRSILWTFQDCDWQGKGFALDLYNVRLVKVDGGFWLMDPNTGNLPLPSDAVTAGGERRAFNLSNVQGFDFNNVEVVATGPGGDLVETNFVLFHTDEKCILGSYNDTMITCDHASATCLFRMSGAKRNGVRERGTRINYAWDNPPVALYAGTGDQPYQISASDVAANSGTVSDEGYYRFSGTTVVTTNDQGRATINLPRRAGGVLPFFRLSPVVTATAGNSSGPVPSITIVSTSSTAFTVVTAGAAANVTLAVYWTAEGF